MNTTADQRKYLVADIGGTNTRIALVRGTQLIDASCAKYANANFRDLTALLARYYADFDIGKLSGACIAVAGPVRNGSATMSNLSWSIDADLLAPELRTRNVVILNDLQAQGYGLALLSKGSCKAIVTGTATPADATKLVVGMGTGFNAAVVLNGTLETFAPSSECGHVSLPVNSAEDYGLKQSINAKLGYCEIDDVLSGRGLEQIYGWHAAQKGSNSSVTALEIMNLVTEGKDPVATATARQFIQLAGSAIADLALTHLPFGGIYLAGGVSRAFGPFYKTYDFETVFRSNHRLTNLMSEFSVSIIEDDNAALLGCARYLEEIT